MLVKNFFMTGREFQRHQSRLDAALTIMTIQDTKSFIELRQFSLYHITQESALSCEYV